MNIDGTIWLLQRKKPGKTENAFVRHSQIIVPSKCLQDVFFTMFEQVVTTIKDWNGKRFWFGFPGVNHLSFEHVPLVWLLCQDEKCY